MSYDVVVLGEVLIELSSTSPWRRGSALTLGFSGDALNSAAAAAAAGARVALLTRVAEDELGDQLVARIAELGVDTAQVRRTSGENGVYFVHADPDGAREFVYVRRGSAASSLSAEDVRDAAVGNAGVVLASGVTCALSSSAAGAVRAAATSGARFVYDPNFRPRLTSRVDAADQLRALAPHAELVTPSCAAESSALLGVDDPRQVVTACRQLGARSVAVTCGADGVWLSDGSHLPSLPAPRLVDQTGAGDVFVGTVAARLALGDDLLAAARLGTAAASLSLAGAGGTGVVPSLAETRAHLATAVPA
ncbi:MAG: 2-dehydro-3-deoxygluconokinase [Pseudonocardiales bacterium]|nr:2-dehydro-3-deoxygluconokinase [Pseudonocardiales bacterium]